MDRLISGSRIRYGTGLIDWILGARSLPLGYEPSMTNDGYMYAHQELLFSHSRVYAWKRNTQALSGHMVVEIRVLPLDRGIYPKPCRYK